MVSRQPTDLLCMCVSVQFLGCFQLSVMLWTVAHQALLSMGFARQEYWNEFPFPSPGNHSQSRDQTYVSYVSFIGRWMLYH